MSEDPKSPRLGGDPDRGKSLLDTVARRLEAMSLSVAERTKRLLERPDASTRASDEELATILEAARRSSELARELVVLARRERDRAASALTSAARRAAPSEAPIESVPAFSHRRVKNDAEGSVVLLVEDEPLLLKTMRRMLDQYGHRVLAAASAVEALAMAMQEREIDLVVTDLVLPGMTGSELVKQLRAARAGLRVLYTSGWDPASSGVMLAEDGSEAFLSKPFTAAELDASLCELLGTPSLRLAERR
ncbi:MAG TPA: response regulator [Polyangiaceae bacterium]